MEVPEHVKSALGKMKKIVEEKVEGNRRIKEARANGESPEDALQRMLRLFLTNGGEGEGDDDGN